MMISSSLIGQLALPYLALPYFTLGALTFLAPLTLIGLIALPFIWWLLRVTPPKPRLEDFPPLRILQTVTTQEETPDSTPWWLLLLRTLLLALLAFGLARPILTQPEAIDERPLTLIIDNGWDASVNWSAIMKDGEALDISKSDAVWLSAGYDFGAAQTLGKALTKATSAERLAPPADSLPLLPGRVENTADGLRSVWWRATQNSIRQATVSVHSRGGDVLERQERVRKTA